MLFYLAEWEEEEPGEDLVSEIDEEEKDEADEDEGDVCYLKKIDFRDGLYLMDTFLMMKV